MTQFSTYLIVGLVNFLVCITTMHALALLGIHYLLYTAAGYGLAICCSFFLNLKFTFTESEFSQQRMMTFFLTSLSNLGLVELIEYQLITALQLRELYAIIIGMSWYTLSGFIINKFFVYASSEQPAKTLKQPAKTLKQS